MLKQKANQNKPIKGKKVKKEPQERSQQRKNLQKNPERKELPAKKVRKKDQAKKEVRAKKVNTIRKKEKDTAAKKEITKVKNTVQEATIQTEAIIPEVIHRRKLMTITTAPTIQAVNTKEQNHRLHQLNLSEKNLKKKVIIN